MKKEAGRRAAAAIRDWVAKEMGLLLQEAESRNARLAEQLQGARRDLGAANQEVARLTAELAGLERELEERPPMPDELLELVRQELQPVFQEFRQRVEAMEPSPATEEQEEPV